MATRARDGAGHGPGPPRRPAGAVRARPGPPRPHPQHRQAAAVATWAGTSWVAAGLALGGALSGALNVVPVALLCLGAALFGLGWLPQSVPAVGLLPAAGGYLLLVLADTFRWPGWVRALSPFDRVAAVPAEPVDTAGAPGTAAVAVLLAAIGLARYARRDLRG